MTTDDLFALPASDFVAARDALARSLRADGDREGAAEVKGLVKPNAVAAALNALARADGVLDAVWAAADRARGGSALRDAIAAAVDRVEGTAATRDGVQRVLQDAAADATVRAQVVEGRLSRPPSAQDGDPLAAWAASLGQEAPKARPERRSAAKRISEEDERRAALAVRLDEARALLEETARAAEAAGRIADDRREALDEARLEAERARAAAADAQKAARDAQAQAEEAASALQRAERTVRRLEGELG